ncbi:MAG: HD domain-containing protein [Bacilli bacterium]
MLNEEKVFKDSVLGYVKVNDQIIWDLINTAEFQRLRRIKHLGGASMVFHTAEHSRFTHSLGVYEITRRMLDSIEGLQLNTYERILMLCSALLHDLGHGPLSHAFETISSIHHENMTMRIIREQTEINLVLTKYDKNLINDICDVLSHKYHNELITSLISSQIDADRLDYLVRDAYNSGVVYGITDIERLFRIAKVVDNKVCFKKKSIKELEIYLLSRICMYDKLYFHPNGRSYELLFQNTLVRYNDLIKDNFTFKFDYSLLNGIGNEMPLSQFHLLDDATIIHYMKQFFLEKDYILSDLSTRFINRDLFEFSDYFIEGDIAPISEEIKHILKDNGFDDRYYFINDTMSTNFYVYDEAITICDENNLYELDDVSNLISRYNTEESVTYVYYPKEVKEHIEKFF